MRFLLPALFVTLAACNPPMSHLRADAGEDVPPSDAASAVVCDPHRAPCRATLTCTDFGQCEGVRLATGAVEPVDDGAASTTDVQVSIGRYLGLFAPSDFCRFGESPGTSTASFDTLGDVPTDPALCAWDMGPNLLCGVNTSDYTPACLGDGLLVRDSASQLHRLRVLADDNDASGWHVEIEWMAIDE